MAIFKYTVANSEGKKLSGTVEAPDEKTTRLELNNLGFSILSLQEIKEVPKVNNNLTSFTFEGYDKNSKIITGTIPASDAQSAYNRLDNEYNLNITAIWRENASKEEIEKAKEEGTKKFQDELQKFKVKEEKENLTEKKKIEFTKEKIEHILKDVGELLQKFDKELDGTQKSEINKRINKILRIKNSTNLEYIYESAKELLEFIEEQEKSFQKKGLEEKKFEFKIATKNLLDELKIQPKPKTLTSDIIEKIENWQRNIETKENLSFIEKILSNLFAKIKEILKKPATIVVLEDRINTYNKQIWELIKLYFKEPTPEYKEKVKNSIKTVWKARKQAKEDLKKVKESIKENFEKEEDLNLPISFTQELNALSGWLLGFYIIYYFISLYLGSKDFGIRNIPDGFLIYQSHLFKYALVIIFLLHSCTSVKLNFFKNNTIANIILPMIFIFGSIFTLLNF